MRKTPPSLSSERAYFSRMIRLAYVIMLETAEGTANLGGTTVIPS